jgi:serine/threonine protein kinase
VVALKVLKTKKVDQEPYQRFVREIDFLRKHQNVAGLLPLLDAHLPAQPTKDDPAWLAMPIATPITKALAERPLQDVARAVGRIAETLAALQRDSGIAHRDIKPGNLYELNGEWLVGDFGLISIPGVEGLTRDGRQVGPTHYTAFEMIDHPSTADPHPADVYSLGKTLWVLATGQNWPPEGHQPAGMSGFSIGDYRPYRNTGGLDELVDRMTKLRPQERPTMEQVSRDLAAWQQLQAEPEVFDLSDRRLQIRAKLQGAISEHEAVEQLREDQQRAIRRLQELMKPLNSELKKLFPGTEIDKATDQTTANLVRSRIELGGRAELINRWHRCTRVTVGRLPLAPELKISRSVEVFRDGRLAFTWMVHAAPEGVMGGTYFSEGPRCNTAPAGTVEADRILEDQVGSMAEAVKKAVDALLEALPES